jgi:hypothetical protein
LLNGQSVRFFRFFEVVDGSVDQLTSLNDPRFRPLMPGGVTDTQASVASTSGVTFLLRSAPTCSAWRTPKVAVTWTSTT